MMQSFFLRICKTRKMQSLLPECSASAVHMEKRLEKQNRNDSSGKQTGCMNKESSIKKICAEAEVDDLSWTRAKQFPPTAIPQTTLKSTSQNPHERRNSLEGNAALLSLRSISPTPAAP
jgi:hypothetical protein